MKDVRDGEGCGGRDDEESEGDRKWIGWRKGDCRRRWRLRFKWDWGKGCRDKWNKKGLGDFNEERWDEEGGMGGGSEKKYGRRGRKGKFIDERRRKDWKYKENIWWREVDWWRDYGKDWYGEEDFYGRNRIWWYEEEDEKVEDEE